MEKIMNTGRSCFMALLFLITFQGAWAQKDALQPLDNPAYGPDSAARMECANNLSSMSEFMKIDLPNYALDAWRYVFHHCPSSSSLIYRYGVDIMKYMIENAETEEEKEKFTDTLFLVYDKRIEYFDNKGFVLGRKGIDILKYRKKDLKEAYEVLKQSVQLQKEESEYAIMGYFMQVSGLLFKKNMIEASGVVEDYTMVSDYLETNIEKSTKKERGLQMQERIDEIFTNLGAADCEQLISIYQPRFDENKDNPKYLKKAAEILQKTDCEDTPFYAQVSERLFSIEPSAESASYLAKLFMQKEEYQKAVDYYEKAIELETEAINKANFYFNLAAIKSDKFKDYPLARSLAYKAIELRPDWGEPYILIGDAYASSSKNCGENDFEKSAVYWAAVDKYIKAKNVDPSMAEEANQRISQYSRYFPDKEDAFFYDYTVGKSYTVGCWINETTSVRF
ncbi:MAG: tetratricopeptide repeat protein [Bacteroidota bacterium]